MIFGRTIKEREARREARKAASMVWHPFFAWRGVPLMDGRWVWLEKVERINYSSPEIPSGTPIANGWRNSWCFRLPVINPPCEQETDHAG